jgi:hypothetical protein
VNGQVLRILRKLKDEPNVMRAAFWKASRVAQARATDVLAEDCTRGSFLESA